MDISVLPYRYHHNAARVDSAGPVHIATRDGTVLPLLQALLGALPPLLLLCLPMQGKLSFPSCLFLKMQYPSKAVQGGYVDRITCPRYLALPNSLVSNLSNGSPTPGSLALPPANPLPTATTTCPDRISALSLENCTNGALSPLSPSSPSFSSLPASGEEGTGGNGPRPAIGGISFTIGNLQGITGSLQSVYISAASSIPTGLNTGGLVPGCMTAKPLSTGLISSSSIVNIIPIPATGSVSVLPVISGATGQSVPVFSLTVMSNGNGVAGNILGSLLPVITSALQAGQNIPGAVSNHMRSVLPVVTGVPVAVQSGIGGAVNGIGGLPSPIQSAVNGAAQNFNGAAGNLLNPVQSAVSGAVQSVNGAAGTLLGTVNGAVQGGQDANGGASNGAGDNLLSPVQGIVNEIISAIQNGNGVAVNGGGSNLLNPVQSVPCAIVSAVQVANGGLASGLSGNLLGSAQGAVGVALPQVQAGSGGSNSIGVAIGSVLPAVNSAESFLQGSNGRAANTANVPVVKNIISSGKFGGGLGLKSRRRNSKREAPVEIVTVKDVSFCQQNPSLKSCFWVFD